ALVSVKWVDKNKSGAVDIQNVADEIHLTFSRKLAESYKNNTASLSADVANLFDALMIANDPDNPDQFVDFTTAGIASNTSIRIVGNDKIIVIPLSNTFDDGVHTAGSYQFVAGRDKIAIAVDHGTIVDRATPQNFCIASQAVKILPQ
ncbi:MAG: hypothetical protein J6Z11_17090, partial [Candidatus Riflebacteria bacterium]|nr:hypothetical protein [Candidatus Riflebacteria bacterium]